MTRVTFTSTLRSCSYPYNYNDVDTDDPSFSSFILKVKAAEVVPSGLALFEH